MLISLEKIEQLSWRQTWWCTPVVIALGGEGDKGEGLANLGHTVRLFQNKRGKPNALGGIPVTSMFRRGRCWHPARVAGCYS